MELNCRKTNLTSGQKNIYMMDKLHTTSNLNNIFGIINVNKDLDIEKINKIINKIVELNDALRINIIEEDETYQIVREFKKCNIESINIDLDDKDAINEQRKDFISDIIDVLDEKLYRFKILYDAKRAIIFVKMHHIISDAWSFSKLAEQFIVLYENQDYEIKAPSYIDYAVESENYTNSEKYNKDEEFFKEYLMGINEKTSFKESDKKEKDYEAARYHIKLDEKLNIKINEFCKKNKISVYVFFLTILAVYMYRILDKDDFVIGTSVLGRSNFSEKQMLGMFVSTIPLRIKIEENMSILELASNISKILAKIFRHQKYPYIKMLEQIHKSTEVKNNLYDIVLSYQNARIDTGFENKYNTSWEFLNTMLDELQIHIVDMDNTGTLAINYDYLKSHFEEIEIEFLHNRIVKMIKEFIEVNDRTVDNIDILCDSDKESINKINDTFTEIDYNQTPINMFKKQVVKNERKLALVCGDKTYTYEELDKITNRIANFLIFKGLKKSDVIAIMTKRNENIVFLMIACAKIGVTYVPIDTRFPQKRINYILSDSKCKYLISDENKNLDVETIILDFNECEKFSCKEIKYIQDYKDICYLIYTSGSTGNPKGVMISNKNLSNFLVGINEKIKLDSKNNLLSITTISFDIYELEMWLTLVSGATMCLANDNECINACLLNDFCVKNNVDVIQTTPTKLRMLLNQDSNKAYIKNFKKILLGGESLDENLYKKIKENTNSKIFNVYGPTETTIWSTVKEIKSDKICVGTPIANTKIFIVDKKRRMLPIFSKGELAISGDCVSCGYFKNEEKTKKAFVNVDFQKDIIYLTGDLAKINSNLDMEILNRIDNQIKINGQRIELEEIESLILEDKKINDCAISYRNKKYLVCFYSLKDNNKEINLENLKEELKNKLPLYMIPKIFIKLDNIPYTLNNKKDRKVINSIEVELDNNSFEIIEPKSEIQKILLEEISKVSTLKEIGINTPISIMGIDSLDSIKMQMGLLKRGIKINYTDLLNNQDIISLEKYILNNNSIINETKYDNVNEEYKDILNNDNKNISKEKIKNVILTGATGFLGVHILYEILKENKDSIIYCIIRSKENMNSIQRLTSDLKFYFNGKYINEIGKRIKIIDLDLLDDNFEEKLNSKIKNVNFFIHTAACVKHYGDYNYFKSINVVATENIAKYCLSNDIKLIHSSTLSISGNGFDIGVNNQKVNKNEFDEKSLYIGQDLNNVYAKTKFEAECIILKYMKLGLKANILRYGNLTNRICDLKFQKNVYENAFIDRISTLFKINSLPESLRCFDIEFTPIDCAALATYKIIANFVDKKIYHIFNNNHVKLYEYINILNKEFNLNINIICDKEFAKFTKETIDNNDGIISKTLIQDLDENYELNYNSNIKVMCKYTNDFLEKCGFYWPVIDDKYIIEYIKYFKNLGYIK